MISRESEILQQGDGIIQTVRETVPKVEFEIPDTEVRLRSYYAALWYPEFAKQAKVIQTLKRMRKEAIENPITFLTKSMLEVEEPKFFETIRRMGETEGVILDLASGSGVAMNELDVMIQAEGGKAKTLRLDLQAKFLQQTESPYAVVGDALALPLKSESIKWLISRGLLGYLLEEPGRTKYISDLKRLIELKDQLGKNSSLTDIEKERLSTERQQLQSNNDDLMKDGLFQYDLESSTSLLTKFLSEIGTVLKQGGEARVEPFSLLSLFKFGFPEYNQRRVKILIDILENNNFVSATYYQNPIFREFTYDELNSLKHSLTGLPKKYANKLNQIFDSQNWYTSGGVLVLKK